MRKGFNFHRSFLASGKKGGVCVAKKEAFEDLAARGSDTGEGKEDQVEKASVTSLLCSGFFSV